jgi:hypothetical protein
MWWSKKPKRKEIWDEEICWPIGDIEAAHRIRDICFSAADSAEQAAGLGERAGNSQQQVQSERYERAARAAMQIAMKISDDLVRDASVRQIVGLCMKANDFRTARVLLRAIQAASIREDVFKRAPGAATVSDRAVR